MHRQRRDAAIAKREEREKKSVQKVNELKKKGAAILSAGLCFTTLTSNQLKEVLSMYEVYPNRKPPTKYAKGKDGLLKQLVTKCRACGLTPPGAAVAITAEVTAAAAAAAPPATTTTP
jgi:hypothetical protein